MSNVLVIAVHPDDETLGCGGTILKHRNSADTVFWCIVTSMSGENGFTPEQIAARKEEIYQVAQAYDFQDFFQLGFATTLVDTYPMSELVTAFTKVIDHTEPEIIYLPFHGDVHSDHRAVFRAAYSCTKQFRHPSIKKIYMMETLSETEFATPTPGNLFVPNTFVDISSHLEKKIKIMEIYKGETGPPPFPRSRENMVALARYRGSTAGFHHAEAFMLLKELIADA